MFCLDYLRNCPDFTGLSHEVRLKYLDAELKKVLFTVAQRDSTCLRRKVAAVVLLDYKPILSAVNGPPMHTPCSALGCYRELHHIPSGASATLCRAVHAEIALVAEAARLGISLQGTVVYCTTRPCTQCTNALTEAGVAEVRYYEDYPDDLSREMQDRSPTVFTRIEV